MIYILCVLILGVPVMCAEFIIGRKSKSDTVDAFKKLIPGSRWYYIGYIGILASILILGYYMVISGWTLEYLFQAACNKDFSAPDAFFYKTHLSRTIFGRYYGYTFFSLSTISSYLRVYRKESKKCPTY